MSIIVKVMCNDSTIIFFRTKTIGYPFNYSNKNPAFFCRKEFEGKKYTDKSYTVKRLKDFTDISKHYSHVIGKKV